MTRRGRQRPYNGMHQKWRHAAAYMPCCVQEQAHYSLKRCICILNTSIFAICFDACLHDTILQTMLRNLFSEHIVPLSRTNSTPRFRRWRMIAGNFYLLSSILFSTTTFLRMERKMCFDGKLALNDVSFNKSDFNHIPVAVRSAVGLLYSRENTRIVPKGRPGRGCRARRFQC